MAHKVSQDNVSKNRLDLLDSLEKILKTVIKSQTLNQFEDHLEGNKFSYKRFIGITSS